MKDDAVQPEKSTLLEKLSVISPLRLPGLVVFLISQQNAQVVSGQLRNLIDADEKARSTRCATWALRHRFITGRAALRMVLSTLENSTVPATDWCFGFASNGKPYVQAPKSTIRSFNISYAEDLIAIAVSKEVEVGVDIERGHAIPQDEIPWHLFSENEQKVLKTTPAADFMAAFLRLWTLKEAIAKRIGQGVVTEFSEIDTTAMPVADGLQAVHHRAVPGALLLHTPLTVEEEIIFLSVSTAPCGGGQKGRKG